VKFGEFLRQRVSNSGVNSVTGRDALSAAQTGFFILCLGVLGVIVIRVAVAPEMGLAQPSTIGSFGGALILGAAVVGGRRQLGRAVGWVGRWTSGWRRVAFGVTHAVLTLASCVVALAAYKPFRGGWDVDIISNAALSWARNGSLVDPALPGATGSGYFGTYPTNIPLLNVLHLIALLVGQNAFAMVTLLLGPVLASATVALVFDIARRHGSMSRALLAWLAAWALVGLSPWVAVPYTDTYTLLFPILLLFMVEKALSRQTIRGRLGWLVGFGLVAGVGIQMKMTVVIVAIAVAAVIVAATLLRKGTRVAMGMCAVVLVSSTLVSTELTGIASRAALPTGMIQSQPWPAQYWILTGMSAPYGQWNSSVVALMDSTTSETVRAETAQVAVDERLRSLGLEGYARFAYDKITWVYSDATFYALGEGQMSPVAPYAYSNSIARVIQLAISPTGSLANAIYATALQAVWLLVLVGCLWTLARRLSTPFNWYVSVLALSVLGVTAYQLVGEARARYLLIFVPLFILLAVADSSQLRKVRRLGD